MIGYNIFYSVVEERYGIKSGEHGKMFEVKIEPYETYRPSY